MKNFTTVEKDFMQYKLYPDVKKMEYILKNLNLRMKPILNVERSFIINLLFIMSRVFLFFGS